MYQIIDESTVLRLEDCAHIPLESTTAETLEYQRWLAAGNKPEPASGPDLLTLMARARAEALPIRMHALDVLAGLQGDCLATGDSAGALLCKQARDAVKDMGTLDLLGCADYEAMRSAYKDRWAQLVAPFLPYPALREQFEKAIR